MGEVRFAAATDTGKVRDRNEDRWAADQGLGLFVVSDGMGGAAHGELAAQIVVDTLPGYVKRHAFGSAPCEVLSAALAELSDRLYRRSASAGVTGATATVVAAVVHENYCVIGYLGDSRAYLLRDGRLSCLTTDHTVAQALLERGEIDAAELDHHPARNRLTRYAGMEPPARPDVIPLELMPFDRILLCTDGISGEVGIEDIQAGLSRGASPGDVCNVLLQAANDAGGHDNMTALIIDYVPSSSDGNGGR